MRTSRIVVGVFILAQVTRGPVQAQYVNFESSQVHPITLTPSGGMLLVVNTPDALLEVFTVSPDGGLLPEASIPVGLEPVTVVARSDSQAWVVNHLSDTISIVDLTLGATVRTLPVGDEPTDVVFAGGRAFVTVSQEDAVKVFDLGNLATPPTKIDLFGSDTRALAVSKDLTKVYAVVLNSGNQTTVVNANVIFNNGAGLDLNRLMQLGLNPINCSGTHPPYPPLPAGIVRNRALPDPPNGGVPPVGLVVKWDPATQKWRDDALQDWSMCLPFRLPDHDLFVIDASTLNVSTVDHLGTTLFEVSVNPGSGKIYIPNTEARNNVRFEHPLGVGGHVVDDRLTIVDPSAGNAVTVVDLNTHINRGSDPATNLPERLASISQPGMLVWNRAGTFGYLTAIGSRKLFRVSGGCASGPCIFGATRSAPDAVEVGEGPTGVALREDLGRAYVLNRFTNSIALVNTSSLSKIGEIALHDPSSATIRNGRRFLYDGVDTSGHGDNSCASCHISGNMDELGWDLGNPPGDFVPYGTPGDNVRFIVPQNNQPVTVPAQPPFSAHTGFDPQKGPMTTQTLRGMLEPLHWRGDRGTLNAFNKAFVGLLGAHDIGPVGEPEGLTPAQMELFRQFALGITFPPNPYRNADDTIPNTPVTIPGNPFTGTPTAGQALFLSGSTDAGQSCSACHAMPFGAAGGKLGGINPGDPVTAFAGLFNGNADGVPHSDLKVPHTRNLYEKFGPRFGPPGTITPPDSKTGFGFIHDGSIPDLGTFLSAQVFTLTAQEARDLTVFLMHFPTGIKPSVGMNLTVPAGIPPTGTPEQEQLLATLIGLGNLADAARHCDLVAYAPAAGRLRTYYLNGGIGSGELWTTDIATEPQVTTAALRQGATGPVTFLCATIGSGVRLGADRDLDGHLNGEDCSPGDAAAPYVAPVEVSGLTVDTATPSHLAWSNQPAGTGPGLVYDLVGGGLIALHSSGPGPSTSCLASGLAAASYDDARANPLAGDGFFYLARGRNSCGVGSFGPGGQPIDTLACP